MSKILLRCIAVMAIVNATACKVSQSKSIRAPYTSFFTGNNETLYFIKPLAFDGPQNIVLIDFTFKDNQAPDTLSVTCNYTIKALPANFKKDMVLQADSAYHLYRTAVLFTEMSKDKQVIRYTSKISLAAFMHLMHQPQFHCTLTSTEAGAASEDCMPSGKTTSQLKKLQSQLLPTLDLKIKER